MGDIMKKHFARMGIPEDGLEDGLQYIARHLRIALNNLGEAKDQLKIEGFNKQAKIIQKLMDELNRI